MLIHLDEQLITICHDISLELPADFVGLAIYDHDGNHLKWKYAVGNRNDKYKRIVVRYGKGISGHVIRSGRSMMITSFPHLIIGKPTEYPIMLAEQLIAAIAVPIYYKQSPWGVLLGGNRYKYSFTSKHLSLLNKKAQDIEKILQNCID
ncbi:GAF domain-containing protein [Halalkalibacter urbisdiaboli]|uniref:GAF domain-containing protein n=1 Tax=Halalkalibacter urbisdiaboli TaxID=1960589 RepID=UPI0013FD9F83|nr:GAF domain-containing protein [Halalkalibacter urbisdiaboli]